MPGYTFFPSIRCLPMVSKRSQKPIFPMPERPARLYFLGCRGSSDTLFGIAGGHKLVSATKNGWLEFASGSGRPAAHAREIPTMQAAAWRSATVPVRGLHMRVWAASDRAFDAWRLP